LAVAQGDWENAVLFRFVPADCCAIFFADDASSFPNHSETI
jgi:hypothetical protein